jgi:uncharacterized membrane protein YidH (DUF202 family)
MTTYKDILGATSGKYSGIVKLGVLDESALARAEESAFARGVDIERVLVREFGVPRDTLLKSLEQHYGIHAIEYDERLPVPPELLTSVDGERLSFSLWFPLFKDGKTVIIAANNPYDPVVQSEAEACFGGLSLEFRVALKEDIQWFIQDMLHAKPGHLIGTERTGLAFWRNTMAHWRTRLACYRTSLAKARTFLALLRWGLGILGLSSTLIRSRHGAAVPYYWGLGGAGIVLGLIGLWGYLGIRRSRASSPGHHTLVEVTAATMGFLEGYHFIEGTGIPVNTKSTMLARMGDFLASHSTILFPSPASKERTHLARERNVLAGQRTVAGCYRAIYARARTGLAFIRTGVSVTGFGLGLIGYFGFSLLTIFDAALVLAGLMLVVDGVRWYMPVRKEQSEIPRCPVPG